MVFKVLTRPVTSTHRFTADSLQLSGVIGFILVMPTLRKLVQGVVASIAGGLVMAILAGIIGEFFIELAKERGWYEHPSARVNTAISTFTDFVTHSYFLMLTAFLVGLTIGLWVDHLLRRREANRHQTAIPTITPSEGDLGSLDYVVMGVQSFKDLTKIGGAANKEINRATQIMVRYKLLIGLSNNFRFRRWMASRLASKLTRFCARMNSFSLRLADAGLRGETNVIGLVQMVADASETPALSAFGAIASGIAASANGNARSAEEAIGSVAALRGVSRDLNEACALLVNTLTSYASVLSNFEAACIRMNEAVQAKIVELSSSGP